MPEHSDGGQAFSDPLLYTELVEVLIFSGVFDRVILKGG